MNDFDQRWRTLANKVGGLPEEDRPEPPFGFAARVIAGGRETVSESWDELLTSLGLRAVLVTACLCLVSAGFVLLDWYPDGIETPAMEQTVTNQLAWP